MGVGLAVRAVKESEACSRLELFVLSRLHLKMQPRAREQPWIAERDDVVRLPLLALVAFVSFPYRQPFPPLAFFGQRQVALRQLSFSPPLAT